MDRNDRAVIPSEDPHDLLFARSNGRAGRSSRDLLL